ncbi:hypothetical protein B0H14DRAFT_2952290 [Mycena olivaceomarginata]|nr:hypothetical protein B0H14DRAFT_2952290 [Mycena olivaceomarginata]
MTVAGGMLIERPNRDAVPIMPVAVRYLSLLRVVDGTTPGMLGFNSLFTQRRSQFDADSSFCTMNYTIDTDKFAEYWTFDRSLVYGLSVSVLLVLFCIAAHALYHWTSGARKSLVIATSAMVVFATLQVVIHVQDTVLGLKIIRFSTEGEVWPALPVLGTTNLYGQLISAKDFILVTNNIVTDGLFIYRCFLVWGRRIGVVILPMFMLLATTVLGYLTAYESESESPYFIDDRVAFEMGLVTNIVLMILTAGRIWWIRRDARIVLRSAHVRKYDTAIAIILESGAIYCASIIVYLISDTLSSADGLLAFAIVQSAFPQVMNIAPMLIVVRVGLQGRSVDDSITQRRRTSPGERVEAPGMLESGGGSPSFVIEIGVAHDSAGGVGTLMRDLEKEA